MVPTPHGRTNNMNNPDPRPTGKTKWEIYTSKIAFTIPVFEIPVSLFVVHAVLVVGTIVLVERLYANGVIGLTTGVFS